MPMAGDRFVLASRRTIVAGMVGIFGLTSGASAAMPAIQVEVWRTPGCGCCKAWARRLEAAGFVTSLHDSTDLDTVRRSAGVPDDLAGCHTAWVDGYVVEGHVPLEAIRRLLTERPSVVGLAVPGMPLGSPGMEVTGEPADAFAVIAFAADGSREVYLQVEPPPAPG